MGGGDCACGIPGQGGICSRVSELSEAALSVLRATRPQELDPVKRPTSKGAWQGEEALAPLPDAATLNHDGRLNLDTSFSGADLLRVQLRGTNVSEGPWGKPPTIVSTLATSFGGKPNSQLEIHRVCYRLPLSSTLSFTAGARLDQDDILPLSVHRSEPGQPQRTLGGGLGPEPELERHVPVGHGALGGNTILGLGI